MPRTRTAALVTVVGVSAAALAFAGPASAHVTVSSTSAVQGGYAVMTFRVPTEEKDASTTKVQVQLPTDTPLSYVATQPVPGWTAVATTTKLAKPITSEDGDITEAVTRLTWTATGSAAIAPGQFQQFNVQAGPLPKQDAIFFPAIQTYSNGKVVRWIERAAPGSTDEPQYPAPELELAAEGSTANAHGGAASSAAPSVTAQQSAAPAESSSNTGPIVLSIIALVLAAGALGLAIVNRARRSA